MLMSCPSLARDQFGLFFFFVGQAVCLCAGCQPNTFDSRWNFIERVAREKHDVSVEHTYIHTYMRVSFRRSREQVVASCVLVTTSRCSSEYLQVLVTNNVIESRSWDRRATGSALPVFVLPASLIAYSARS